VSVRVCYISRAERGSALRSVRLLGQTSDETWPDQGVCAGLSEDYAAAAAWVRQRLDATRSATSVSVLCLDVDGSACTWLTSPSAEPAVVASVARLAEGERAGTFEFFAPGELSSTLQALPASPLPASNGTPAPARLPVLAIQDVPGRLMVDELDARRVPVESVASLWHVLAWAWDASAAPGVATDAATDAGPVTAVVLTDPDAGRLVWCWSRGGRLLVAGSQRLRVARADADGPEGQPPAVRFGEPQVARLICEWLSWSVQVRAAPGRIMCVLTPGEDAGVFAEALGKAWPGAAVDAVTVDDPIGVTLRRAADRLESTPRTQVGTPEPGTGLVALSGRPGLVHRRMHRWRALALVGLAGLMGLVAWRLRLAADDARHAAEAIDSGWRSAVREIYPAALEPMPGESPLKLLDEELRRRRRDLLPPERTDEPMPILQELETITMVIGAGDFALESIDLRSVGSAPRVMVLTRTNEDAYALEEAFRRVGGSYVMNWAARFESRPEGTETRIRVTLTGEWNAAMIKAAGTGGTGGTGGSTP
jgi:hypothetical protein